MTLPAPGNYDLSWRRGNVLALLALCVLAGGWLAVMRSARTVSVGARIPVDSEKVARATEKIDPNVATPASLRRLPGIGPTIAERIVEYRQARGERCFRRPEDLLKVPRIGPKTVENVRRHLKIGGLEGKAADSQPSGGILLHRSALGP